MTTAMSNRYWDGDTVRIAGAAGVAGGHGAQGPNTFRPAMAEALRQRPVEPGAVQPGAAQRSAVEPGAAGYGPVGYGPAPERSGEYGPVGPDHGGSGTVAHAATVDPRPSVDATRLWSGGMATAVVAALIGLVGVLVVRAAFHIALFAPAGAAVLGSAAAVTTLCLLAAAAALAATGLAQLLIVSTPRPLAYLGWIVGLATAAATVAPLLGGFTAVALAQAVIHLVIGLAIGSLVAGSAAAATRPARRY